MNPESLSSLSDEQLTEAFALEVAGWAKANRFGHFISPQGGEFRLPPQFATSVNAVLPHLEAWRKADAHWREVRIYHGSEMWHVILKMNEGYIREETILEPTLARALCAGLILATRAAAEAKEGT